jgi:hypothetical protein
MGVSNEERRTTLKTNKINTHTQKNQASVLAELQK